MCFFRTLLVFIFQDPKALGKLKILVPIDLMGSYSITVMIKRSLQ